MAPGMAKAMKFNCSGSSMAITAPASNGPTIALLRPMPAAQQAGRANGQAIELDSCGIQQDLRTDGGGSSHEDQQVEHRHWAVHLKQTDRQRRYGEEHHHHLDQVQAVTQPTTQYRTDDAAQVQRKQERQARAEAVSGARHELGQSEAQRLHHQKAADKGNPDGQGAHRQPVAEQLADRATTSLILVDLAHIVPTNTCIRCQAAQQVPGFLGMALANQETHRLWQPVEDGRQQRKRQGRHEEHRAPAEPRQHVDAPPPDNIPPME